MQTLHYAVGKGSKRELHAEKCTSHGRAVRGTYFYFKCTPCVRFCPIQNQTRDLTLFSHSVVSDSFRPRGLQPARPASLTITISLSLLKLMSIESVMPSNHLILSRPFLLLPSIFPSIRVFPNESALHIRWPKY